MGLFGGNRIDFGRPAPLVPVSPLNGLAPLGSDRVSYAHPPDTMSTYRPSWREWLTDKIGELAETGFGAGRYTRQDIEKKAGDVLDLIPPVGVAFAGNEARRAFDRGDWKGVGASALGGALLALPFARPVAKAFAVEARGAARGLRAGLTRAEAAAAARASNLARAQRVGPSPGAAVRQPPVSGLPAATAERAVRPPHVRQSLTAGLNEPPVVPQRPFALDYPNGATADQAGNLRFDIEGRPLVAKYIAGRRTAGGPDEPVDIDGLLEMVKKLTRDGGFLETNMPEAGVTHFEPGTGKPTAIVLNEGVAEEDIPAVLRHEIGHAIERGKIPADPNSIEMRGLFHTLNRLPEDKSLVTPQSLGYSDEQAPSEHWAEAIRAYITDPNAMKSLWPDTAARIRAYVNPHPDLKNIIQFNSVLGGLGLGVGAAGAEREKQK